MRKLYITALFLISSISLFAQINFKQVFPPSPAPQIIPVFEGVDEGAIAYADVDDDGSIDVLITGSDDANQLIAKLYLNDGTGNYKLASGTPFEGVKESAVAFADIDGDDDQDVVITGLNSSAAPVANLYTNDGFGVFTLVAGTPFEGVRESAIAFADVNGNGFQDLFITGRNAASALVKGLYLNNGSGIFAEANAAITVNVSPVNKGAVAFADINGDGTKDLLVTGINTLSAPIAELYTNNAGTFTKVAGTPFTGVSEASVAFADVDNVESLDLLISGANGSSRTTTLYTNDGAGVFTASTETFEGLRSGSVDFSDIDGNDSQDLIISGINASAPVTKLYSNDGNGAFTLVAGTPFDNVRNSAIAFIDFDGDENEDLLLTGLNTANQTISKMYLNDGSGNFSLATGTPFEAVRNSAHAFGDVDGDGDQDVLITGRNASDQTTAKLYTNDGNGNYTVVSGTPFTGVENGAVAFADVDGVNGLDVLITGIKPFVFDPFSPEEYVAKLYLNDGSGNFTLKSGTPFEGVQFSSVAFADVDGDNLPDVVITGQNSSIAKTAKLYLNNWDITTNFLAPTSPFVGVRDGSIAFADVDGTNLTDVIITGNSGTDPGTPISNLYLNNGSGVFSLDGGNSFDGVKNSSVAFADVDDNSDVDVLITGLNGSSTRIAKLYTNIAGTFTLEGSTPFTGVDNGAIAFANIDGVGGQDVIITGDNGSQKIAALYTNNGSGVFTAQSNLPFDGISNGDVAFGEIDGNTLPDVLITGINNVGLPTAKLYRNTTDFVAPNITSAATASVEENVISTGYTPTADEAVDFSLGTTKDEGLFRIVAGVITFKSAPDFEAPSDADANNIYLVDVIATDQGNNTDVLEVAITVTDVDDTDPTITSAATASVEENITGTVYTATADETVTFTLGNSKDEALFTLATAAISFTAAPDFENPADANTDNIYLLDIIATDGAGNSSTLEVAITVTDLSDVGPTITSAATATVEENVTGTIYTATADGTATFSLGNSKDEGVFTLTTDAISFTASPDFETPLDGNTDNVYLIDLIATDANGSSTLEVAITVSDVDEVGPVITSAAFAIVEENVTGTVYTVTTNETATYALGSSKDEALFTLTNAAISFNSAPNFEAPLDANADNSYLLDIIATDGLGNETIKAISINVTNVVEAGPVITSASTVSVEENVTGTIYTVTAESTATFSLGTNKDEAAFTLTTDAISFTASPDFETPIDADANNVYLVDVIASDGDGNTSTIEVEITVTDLDEEDPTITSAATASIEENTTASIYTATADEEVTYSIGSSKDEALFSLATDVISFNDVPDFENPLDANADNVYLIDLIATDAAGNTATLEVAISVTDVDEAGPVITSAATATVEENITGTVYTITSDVAATYSIGSSKDEALFTLATDAISFKEIPDFETPLDTDANNVYLIDVIATDGDGNATTKAVAITVTDIDESGPTITSEATATVEENVTGTVYTITTDVPATYSLGSSNDEALFSLSTDAISFNDAPDFETPLDADANNVYLIEVIATDGDGLSTSKEISITVTDVEEGPVAVKDELLFSIYPNPFTNQLVIEAKSGVLNEAMIVISDLSGKTKKSIKYNGGTQELDLSGLKSGVYILAIPTASGLAQYKIVKQ